MILAAGTDKALKIDTPVGVRATNTSACATEIGPGNAYRRAMRQLRFLRPGDDGNHVILETADGAEQFVVYVTVPLRDAIRVDLPKLSTGPSVETDDGISPREIQVRVRGGADPEALAEAHGMTLASVLRFAGPVLDERVRVADTARRGRARCSSNEGQTVVFGETVDSRFEANGIDPFVVRWDAYRRLDGQWVVAAKWNQDEEEFGAEWAFNLTARNVTPIDDNASDLLSDRLLRVPVVTEQAAAESAPEPIDEDAPPLAPGVVAFPRLAPAPPVIDTQDGADVGDGADQPGPVEDVFDQDALDALDAMADVEADPRHLGDEPDLEPVSGDAFTAQHLPLRLAESHDEPAADGDGERVNTKPLPRLRNLGVAERDDDKVAARPKSNQRPKVPAWDDIVLGVRRPTE